VNWFIYRISDAGERIWLDRHQGAPKTADLVRFGDGTFEWWGKKDGLIVVKKRFAVRDGSVSECVPSGDEGGGPK